MGFPQVVFGICDRCGRRGYDIDSDTGASSASTGYRLKEHNGEKLCQLCINELKDDAHAKQIDNEIREGEKFRDSAGVQKA